MCKHKLNKQGKHRKIERVKVKLDEENPAKRISKEDAKKFRLRLAKEEEGNG